MKIGDQIRAVRKRKKVTQEELAEVLNISQKAYSKIENGETALKVKRLKKIANYLNVSTAYFFENNDALKKIDAIKNKERALYIERIQHQEQEIDFLKSLVKVMQK